MSDNIPSILPATTVAVMALVGTTFSDGVMSDFFCVSLALTSAWLIGVFLSATLYSLVGRRSKERAAATDEGEIKARSLPPSQRKRIARRSKRANAALRRR